MLVPNLRSPARVVLYPRMRKVETVTDLAAFRPPPFCSSNDIPSFSYTSSQMQRGRKLLRFLAAGAFLAGAIIGGITGGGVAATAIEPLKAEIFHIQQVNAHTAEALAVISNSLDGMHNLINLIQTEEHIFKEQTKEELREIRSTQSTNYFLTLCNMYRSQAMNLETELQTLFSTGLGRRTEEFQAILNPEFENYCSDGLCQLHLLQIFLDNSIPAYRARAYPQPWEERTELNLMTPQWVTPTQRFLWAHLNDTPIWIPLDDAIN